MTTSDDSRLENARVAYQVAASLWVYEGGLIWSKFNALLVAHSVFLAGISLSMTSSQSVPLLEKTMPLAGLALCALWFLLLKRGFDNHTYWVLSAREIEERYLADAVKTVSRGADFAAGTQVTFQLGGQVETRQLPRVSWILNAERASYATMVIFAAIYGVLGLGAWGCL